MSTVETAPETAPDADDEQRPGLRERPASAARAVWRSWPVQFVRADLAGHRECQALGRRRAGWAIGWLLWRVGVPVLVMIVQQPGWSRGWHALTNRMVTWRKQLGSAAVVAALVYLFGIAPLVLTVAAPALVPLSFGAGRLVYPLVPRGRARTRYEPDGWLTADKHHEELSADAARRTALYTRPSVKEAVTRPDMTQPSEMLLRRMPVSECGTWLGNTAIGTTFRAPCYASLEAAVGLIAPPRKWKALALDTPIATPTGWTTMGEIQVGDQVFDRNGKVCSVTGTSEVFHDRPCYDVTTNDGEVITADAEHLWVARLSKKSREGVHTTETIARARNKKASITTAPALDLPDSDLPIDPYLLGVWLGDGRSSDARIYTADPEVVDRIAAAGYTTRKTTQPFEWRISRGDARDAAVCRAGDLVRQGYSGRQARMQAGVGLKTRLQVDTPRRGRAAGPRAASAPPPVRSVREDLGALGVLGDKHVPASYFRTSAAQRLALLQGLVDSDGGVEPTGQVTYCSTSYQLARDVRELVFSLGVKASIRSREAQLDGRPCGTEYRVRFFMRDAASLSRKAERCRDASEARSDRYVVATPTTSVLTRCIAVDSPTRTYLAGRSLLPTHNTALMGHHICDAPGAVLSTQTKPETYFKTRAVRQKKSRDGHGVLVLDPEGLTGEVSLRFSPVTGARDPKFAQLMGSMLAAAADGPGEDREWFAAQCATALQFFLLIADVAGKSMVDVYRWAQGAGPAMDAVRLASRYKTGWQPGQVPPGWAAAMKAVMETEATRTRDAIMMTLAGAVGFMGDRAVAEVCSAPTAEHPAFDVPAFIANRGAVYLIASDRKHNKVAPLLAAFTGWLFETAKDLAVITGAEVDPGKPRRLDPPLTLVLDEIANTIPLPLDLWIADSGGRGIRIIWSVQSRSQLRTRWGADAADTIWNATTTKLMAGGSSVESDLEGFSSLCGTKTVIRADGTVTEVPVMKPSDVRKIPRWHAALLHDTSDVTLVRIWPVWLRKDVLTATWTPKRPASAPVLEQTDVEQALAEIEAAVQPEPAAASSSGGR